MRKSNHLIFSSFIFLVGVSSGTFLEIFMNPSEQSILSELLGNYLFNGPSKLTFSSLFISSALGNLLLLSLIFIAGLSALGFPMAYGVLFYKGAALGFVSGILLNDISLKNVGSACISLIPQNIIIIPVFIFAASIAHTYGKAALISTKQPSRSKRYRADKNGLHIDERRYITLNSILALLVILGATIESLSLVLFSH